MPNRDPPDSPKPESPKRRGPVIVEIGPDAAPAPDPAAAPLLPDVAPGTGAGGAAGSGAAPPRGAAMQAAAGLVGGRGGGLGGWVLGAAGALLAFILSVALWDFVTGLLARNPLLGLLATALVAVFLIALAALALREAAAIARLGRIDALRDAADAALEAGDLAAARGVIDRLSQLYRGRPGAEWGLQRLAERRDDLLDADALIGLAETELLAPLDARARREVEAAARQVAAITALVPLALADVVAALTANLRMIRRIAEIYGGRAGALGAWRLTRAVFGHLVATGAVAVGDDLIHSVAGGGLLSRLSRRFGEGVVNGALTARVGVAALEVCRPLPFARTERPSVTGIVRRALAGLFGPDKEGESAG